MQRCFCTVGFRIQIVVRVRRVFFLHFSAAESLGRREGRPASGGLAWAGRGEFCSRLDIVFHSSERGRLACLARYAREREREHRILLRRQFHILQNLLHKIKYSPTSYHYR